MTTALLRRPGFALFAGARTVSVFGNALGPLALTFAVLALPGATPVALSVVLAALAVPRIGLMLLGGVIGDRLPRHRVLVAAELGGATAYGLMAVLVLSGRATVPALTLTAALAGAASALLLPSLTGVVAELVDEPDRQRANALLRLGTNSATVVGFLASGAITALVGPGWALAADAVTFAVAAGLLAALRLVPARRPAGRNLLGELRQGWREFTVRQWLWTVVLAAAFINAAVGVSLGLAGPVYARDRLGGAAAWSGVLAGYATGMLAGVVLAMRVRPARPLRAAVLAATALAAPALLLSVGAPLVVVIAGAVLAGAAFDVFGVLWETTFQREVPREAMSRVSAYEWLGAIGLGPVAMLVAGPAVAAAGADRALFVLGLVTVAAALAPLGSRQVRDYGRATDG